MPQIWTKTDEAKAQDLMKRFTAKGMSRADAIQKTADKLGRTYDAVRIKTSGISRIDETTREKYNKPLVCKGDALILELHAPYHKADLVNKCVEAAVNAGVPNLVLGGDAIDNETLSTFAPYMADEDDGISLSPRIEELLLDIARTLKGDARHKVEAIIESASVTPPDSWVEARAVFRQLSANFERVYWMIGNHEDRIARMLNIAFSTADMARLLDAQKPKYQLTSYYWMRVISGGVTWQIEHPNVSGKGAGKRVANAQDVNIVMQHNHHFSVTKTSSGKFFAIEPGCVADFDALNYEAKRHGGADRHVNGAVMLVDGRPVLLQDGWSW